MVGLHLISVTDLPFLLSDGPQSFHAASHLCRTCQPVSCSLAGCTLGMVWCCWHVCICIRCCCCCCCCCCCASVLSEGVFLRPQWLVDVMKELRSERIRRSFQLQQRHTNVDSHRLRRRLLLLKQTPQASLVSLYHPRNQRIARALAHPWRPSKHWAQPHGAGAEAGARD